MRGAYNNLEKPDLRALYQKSSSLFAHSGEEEDLMTAHNVGRNMLENGLGIIDLYECHAEASQEYIADNSEAAKRHEIYFMEVLSVFEMAQKGYRLSISTLKSEIEERRRVEEDLRQATYALARQRDLLEGEVAKRTAQIRKTIDKLHHANEQLQQINKEQGEFTYAISHDLKAPTNTIGMLLEVLLEDFAEEIPAGAMELLKRQQDVVSRMVSLIDDVLKYSISVETALEPEEVHLNEVFEEVLRDLQCQIVDAGSQIDVPKLPLVIGCRTQLRIMFQNLISNAIKFRFPGRPSHVQIKSKHLDDGQLKISVCDNGIGIPQKHCDRIFGLFQRLHAHHEYSGSGLGLAVCKRIAARHGGEITVQSEPDQGSEFSICLKKG